MQLIDIEPLQKERWHLHRYVSGVYEARVEEMKLEKVPTIDAVPVVHGKWIEEKPNSYTSITKCSVCGESAPFICKSDDYYGVHMYGETEKTIYCPGCGAKMDLEE